MTESKSGVFVLYSVYHGEDVWFLPACLFVCLIDKSCSVVMNYEFTESVRALQMAVRLERSCSYQVYGALAEMLWAKS